MRFLSIATAFVAGLLAVAPAHGVYVNIEADLADEYPDTSYASGVLSIYSDTSDNLVLNDPVPQGGTITNTVFSLSTYFQRTSKNQGIVRMHFADGDLSLSFDYDPDGTGPAPSGSHFINGPISSLALDVFPEGPDRSLLLGGGLFNASFLLPGSDGWPAPLSSAISTLGLAFTEDLTGFDWETGALADGRIDSAFTLVPKSYPPEPATVLLVLIGGPIVCRRSAPHSRRAHRRAFHGVAT